MWLNITERPVNPRAKALGFTDSKGNMMFKFDRVFIPFRGKGYVYYNAKEKEYKIKIKKHYYPDEEYTREQFKTMGGYKL